MRARIPISLLTSACVASLAVPALAQGASTSDSLSAPLDAGADTGEAIVVTGSRIIANGNNSPTPLTVVSTEQLMEATPSNIPDALNKLPIFQGSSNQRTAGAPSANAAGNFLDLRGIGTQRGLVLFDGNRMAPSATSGGIDTNTIPQALIKRVDIVTGGASAVYGSDAVSGVINFIVDDSFEGLKASGQYGISSRGDNASQRLGLVGGTYLMDGRAHIEASYEYYNSDGIGRISDRPYGVSGRGYSGTGTAASPNRFYDDMRRSDWTPHGAILSGIFADTVFNPDGSLRPFNHGAPTGSANLESGGDGGRVPANSLIGSLETHQAFGRFDFDLTDDTRFFVQGSYTRARNINNYWTSWANSVQIGSDNAFLRPEYRDALNAAGEESFTFTKMFYEAPPIITDAKTTTWFVNTGLKGELFGDLRWEATYSHSETQTFVTARNNENTGRLLAALDATTDANGNIVCRTSLTNPGLYPGCVPLNPFGYGSASSEAIDYITGDTSFKLTNAMDDFNASIAGTALELPAGPLQFAVSGEYRELSLENRSTDEPTEPLDCTGIRFGCSTNQLVWQFNTTASLPKMSQNVAEGAIEVNAPLLADLPLIRMLAVNGAYRYTHYSTSGSEHTWKIGVDWKVTDDLSLRGTRSRDIRAPTLYDLYAPLATSTSGFADIHTSTSGSVILRNSGNDTLTPEKADTLTAGAVYTPSWLPGLSLSLDYYRIKIKDAIVSLSGTSPEIQAQCQESGGTSPLCDLYVRPLPYSDTSAANYPSAVLSSPVNAATIRTEGVDFEGNYTTGLAGGQLSIRTFVAYQPKLVTQSFEGATPLDEASSPGTSVWRVTGMVGWNKGGFSLMAQTRWNSSQRPSSNPALVFETGRIPAVSYTDLTLGYTIEDSAVEPHFFLSAQNLFDKQPALFGGNIGYMYPIPSNYDAIGRYVTAGVSVKF
ncbi:TonB-dependent receptor domain-containing protein [Novosphingobium aureum]|nr:TonB-dependent receptor [Novosphingobium aureum]